MHCKNSALQINCDENVSSTAKEPVAEASGQGQAENPGKIEWHCHLIARDGLKGAIPIIITVLFCICVWGALEAWYWVALSAAVLFFSMFKYYFPVHYMLNDAGVTTRFMGRTKLRPWSDFRNLYMQKYGVFLAPYEKPSRLDAFRGLGLNCPDNKDEVAAYAMEKLNIA